MNLDNQLKIQFSKDRPEEADLAVIKQNIFLSVARLQRRRLLFRLGFWSTTSLLTLIGFIASGISFYQQFVASGGRELLAVALTDTNVILANGTDFLYSLAESLPIGSIAVTLFAVAALLFSIRHLAELQINNLFRKIYGHQ